MKKGQTSFEYLFIVIIVITATIWIISYYLETHDTTIAVTIAKDELISQMNSGKYVGVITKINPINETCVGCLMLDVEIKPNGKSSYPQVFDFNSIEQKIIENTNFRNIDFNINFI